MVDGVQRPKLINESVIRSRIRKIHELEQEKHKLNRRKEEIKRLERISRSPSPLKKRSASRPKSGIKRNLSHERWTNCYARKSIEWDSEDGMLS